MSEELVQRNLVEKGLQLADYEFYPINATTLNQLKKLNIIAKLDYGAYGNRKPDGIIVDRGNKKRPRVVAVLEFKKPTEFQTDKQKVEATQQCNDLCQVLGARVGVVTDGIVTFWINPNHPDTKNEYLDRTSGKKRSYSHILRDDKQKLQLRFRVTEKQNVNVEAFDEDTKSTYLTIKRIEAETANNNSILHANEKTDPSPLARNVWQSIYISTKDNPTACLYNVVEIFIFKFLSDLKVLQGVYSFQHLEEMYKTEDSRTVLEHYAKLCRNKIKELFPKGLDETSVINGTIFVNKDGSPVLPQATLFKDTIQKYAKFGDLKNIEKEFKTKLFETFLKESHDKSKLGQFFTPRTVVKAIVEMADIDKARFICDPFCGVGGFLLEPLQVSTNLKKRFSPINGVINPGVRLLGYDSGREDNEEQRRTIILAKANMLIYISDLVEQNPTLHGQFSKLINEAFTFLSDSNLGTLKEEFKPDERPDLILTNPPYITSGVTTIKKQIDDEGLADQYVNSGKGVEGLCLKWIATNLKDGGSAFIILPDSIFNVFANQPLRDELLKTCYINSIISLPSKTFFNTPKKTYILGITKKHNETEAQTTPVFTYLASSIGETLDINRFSIEDNDLDKAKNLFNQFKGSPTTFKTDDPRCKLQPISKFFDEKYWVIDKWWSNEEKVELGIIEKDEVVSVEGYRDMLGAFAEKLDEYKKTLEKL